jgi:RNA polymerase sigma-70 factor (ECF subfamily)
MPLAPSSLTDADIIRDVLHGNANAFEGLLLRYQDDVARIVRKHVPYQDVAETAHDVFVRAYQALPTCKQPDEFKAWLTAIAVRTCYDFWRKRYRRREVEFSGLNETQQHWLEKMTAAQAEQIFQTENGQQAAKEVLDVALNSLSAEDRMVVELVYLEGITGKDAARLLGWSVANVKVRLFRARRKLRKLLERAVI